ncbi:MAG: glycosyltransferase [Tabrizicola sp.]|nr:glycosyltransferase [Tabrizicola sp.]
MAGNGQKITLNVLPVGTRALYVALQVLAHLLVPVVAVALLWRSRKEPGHLHHLSHRFGLGPVGVPGAIWVYAASLGETRAASPLIRRLRAAGHTVILSHQSPAGLAEGWRLFPEDPGILHRYVPMDLFWTVRLFLRRARPAALVVLEIELWPAMLIETVRREVPVVMANGNLSDRALRRRNGLRDHVLRLYRLFTAIFTREAAYRDRYLAVGVDPDRVHVVGELKYDQWIDPAHPAMGRALRSRWPGAERVLMIASSVEAEEGVLLPMVSRLLAADPGLRLLWVPRSPQRFDAVANMLTAAGIQTARRSTLGPDMSGQMQDAKALVGDSIGEMNAYYPMADLVFVGASLVDHGGHNIMEPMALGLPVVMGPSTYGIAFAAEPATRMGAFESLPDATALEARIAALLADRDVLARMAKASRTFAATRTGAAERTVEGLQALLSARAEGST